MNRQAVRQMASLLPKTTRVARTPDFVVADDGTVPDAVTIAAVELRTTDLIEAFLSLQAQALAHATEIRDLKRREAAINAVRSMTYF